MKDTKKEKYTAVDYGTGGIYRRAPARKELSKDREWFGMTIVASGRHIATWVNGVQAVDWTDERPLADNPRKGCRLEKGAISLQGHEAATEDLDFRDIRIQDLARRRRRRNRNKHDTLSREAQARDWPHRFACALAAMDEATYDHTSIFGFVSPSGTSADFGSNQASLNSMRSGWFRSPSCRASPGWPSAR